MEVQRAGSLQEETRGCKQTLGDPSGFPFYDNKSPQSIVSSFVSVKTDT